MQPLVQRRYDTPGLSPWCVLYHGLPLRCAGFWGGGDCHPCPCAALCAALSPVPNDCKLSRDAKRLGLNAELGNFPGFRSLWGLWVSLGVSGVSLACLWVSMLKIGLVNSHMAAFLACFPYLFGSLGVKLRCRGCVESPNALNLPDCATLAQRFPLTRSQPAPNPPLARGSFFNSRHDLHSNAGANLA